MRSSGNSGNTTVERPFGDVFVNGFDFDIELNNGYSQSSVLAIPLCTMLRLYSANFILLDLGY